MSEWSGRGQHWDALDEFMNLIGVPNRAEVLKQIKNKTCRIAMDYTLW